MTCVINGDMYVEPTEDVDIDLSLHFIYDLTISEMRTVNSSIALWE